MISYLFYRQDCFKLQELRTTNVWHSFKICFVYTMIILVGVSGTLISVLALEKSQYLLAASPFVLLFPITAILLSKLLED